MARLMLALIFLLGQFTLLTLSSPAAELINRSGHIVNLRVQDVGEGYGGSSDFLDAEVIVALDGHPNNTCGFQLRNDGQRPARQGMLDLLRDAYANNFKIHITCMEEPGKRNNQLRRVVVRKE